MVNLLLYVENGFYDLSLLQVYLHGNRVIKPSLPQLQIFEKLKVSNWPAGCSKLSIFLILSFTSFNFKDLSLFTKLRKEVKEPVQRPWSPYMWISWPILKNINKKTRRRYKKNSRWAKISPNKAISSKHRSIWFST